MRSDMDLDRLAEQHYAALYRFALSLSGHESDASDLVQETFFLLATKGHQLHDSTKVKSWLFTTLYRLFTGGRRRLLRFPEHDLEAVATELPAVLPEPPAQGDWKTLLQCLTRLDETFRAPIALFYLEDYSYNDIAAVLQVPLGTVKSRMARGIAALQIMMTVPERARAEARP
jgi:RNA polymerase sigma factor (sigma-70 family)